MNPALYPFIVEQYVERQEILAELDAARKAGESSSRDLKDKLREATLLKQCETCIASYRELAKSEGEAVEVLRELGYFVRFLREVKSQIGYPGRSVDRRTRVDLCSVMKEYVHLIRPAAVIGRYECSFGEGTVEIEGLDTPIRSRSLCRFFKTRLRHEEEEEYGTYESETASLAPPRECRLFAATVGPGVDEEVARLSDEGETYRALLLNGIGAAAADMVALDIELFLNREGTEPGTRWRRFHVGYGDFRLEEQRGLFERLNPERIGIELNEACIMIPEKSVSGMAALKGREKEEKKRDG